MRKVITSYAVMKLPEGKRIVGTYSTIDDNGDYIEQNQRFSKLAIDAKVIEAADIIESFLESNIPE